VKGHLPPATHTERAVHRVLVPCPTHISPTSVSSLAAGDPPSDEHVETPDLVSWLR
jgi:hypothetical protein